MRRLALIGALVVLLAACGGGGGGSNSDTAKISDVFTAFFSSKEPVASKSALVQDGAKFKSAIEQIASSPLASQTSAKVSSVTVRGPQASVIYTIYLGHTPVLNNTQGLALKVNGKWVIAASTLCKLVKLEGASTPACPKTKTKP